MIKNRISIAFFLLVLGGFVSFSAQGQVVPSAFKSPISLKVGGIVSAFNPGYISNTLGGFGAYADLNIFHGIGVEGEARWQRIHEFESISQDNYLIGPRVQLHPIWRAQPYVKVLGGFSHMNFEENVATGRFTTISFGGGLDFRVSRKLTLRAADFEYQEWPQFIGNSLSPYGVSAGMSYRIF